MNKDLLKIALLSLVCASMPASFTSCKDYDDDIDRLNKEVAENKSAIDNIAQKVSQGGVITSVVPTADGKGIVINMEKDGKTESFTIQNGKDGQNGKDADVWTINAEGYWCKNGEPTEYKAIGQNGTNGADGKPGENGKPGETGAPGDYYKPNNEGYFDLYHWNTETGKWDVTKNVIRYATDGDKITAAVTANDVFLFGVAGQDGAIVLAKTGALRSLVFKPDFYYQGIEAMDAATFKFNELRLNPVTPDGKNGEDAPEVKDLVSMTPALVANYYLNPSSANVENIFGLEFITEDLVYARSASSVTAKIFDQSAKNGILTVKANLQGDIKSINDDDQVTVLALKARLNKDSKAGAADTVIVSDYAAVRASYYTNIDLAVPAGATGVTLSNPPSPDHWYTKAADAIAAEPALTIAWNNKEGIDLSKYIQADYTNAEGKHVKWAKPVNEYGFKYNYELVGYTEGTNVTSQSAHAALNPANNAIIHAQMPKDGKWQPWCDDQNKASVGRMPLVRVSLVDTVSANRPVAAVAYVKLEIVVPGAVPPAEAVTPVDFTWSKDYGYTVSCATADQEFKLAWYQVEERILATLNMEKAEFEKNYELRLKKNSDDPSLAQQVTVAADKSISNAAVEYGKVNLIDDLNEGTTTRVLKWTISANDVYNYFTGSTKPTSMKVTVVYDGKKGTRYEGTHVAVTFTWAPDPLNVNPTAAVDDNSKIAELWYTYNSAVSASNGGKKEETHFNVAVPNNNLTSAACTFINNMLYPFVGNEMVGLTGLNTTIYKDYVNTTDAFEFTTLANAPTEVKGMSGATYVLVPDGAVLKAYIKGQPATTAVEVAKIDNSKYEVEYQSNDVAKDILNYAGAQDLAYGQTLAATVKVTAENSCQKPLFLTNNTYNVRFLRPITVTSKEAPGLEDAHDDGSTLEIAQCIGFKDWRNIAFTTANKYLDYYGVEGVYVGILNATTGKVDIVEKNEDGSPSDITKYVTTNLNGGSLDSQKLSSVLPDIRLTYTPDDNLTLTTIGKLNYKNGGNVLGYAFQIRVPFVVKYKWGYVKLNLDITVKPTIGQ